MDSATIVTAVGNSILALVILFFGAYFKKKGDNAATQEDVRELTKQVEAVKLVYTKQAELAKASLRERESIRKSRYEHEFEVLVRLAEKISTIRDGARHTIETNEADKMLERFALAQAQLAKESSSHYPFYPQEISSAVDELRHATVEMLATRYLPDDGDLDSFEETNADRAVRMSERVADLSDQLLELIRDRVLYWERLDLGRAVETDMPGEPAREQMD